MHRKLLLLLLSLLAVAYAQSETDPVTPNAPQSPPSLDAPADTVPSDLDSTAGVAVTDTASAIDSALQRNIDDLNHTLVAQKRTHDSLMLLLRWTTLSHPAGSEDMPSDSLGTAMAEGRADSVAPEVPAGERPFTADPTLADSADRLAGEASPRASEPDTLAKLVHRLQALTQAIDSMSIAHRASPDSGRVQARYVFRDSHRRQAFATCVVDPARSNVLIVNRKGKKRKRNVWTFSTLHQSAEETQRQLVFAMNAGMFEPNRRAKGLLISDGRRQQALDTLRSGYGNFYMQPNGVFALDNAGRAYVVPTQQYDSLASTTKIEYATQSGPMMLVDGQGTINDKFGPNSPNRHIRNAVGVTPYGQVVFAISERRVTFHELSTYLKRHGCVSALYLDGAISQAYLPALGPGWDDLRVGERLGPIVVIVE